MPKKYIVFDLDETLGTFVQLGIFKDTLEATFETALTQRAFNDLCKAFIKSFRPNLIQILKTIQRYKNTSRDIYLVIYTNNIGPKSWTIQIKTFLEDQLHEPGLFDHIIGGYIDMNNQRTELCRTTMAKLPADIRRCIGSPQDAKYLFFDDQHHPKMIDQNVTYIKSKPYRYEYTHLEMIRQFLQTNLAKYLLQHYQNPQPFSERFANELAQSRYNPKPITQNELNVDIAITKQMQQHIDEFLAN